MKYRFTPNCHPESGEARSNVFSESNLDIYGLTPMKIYDVTKIEVRKTRHKTSQTFLRVINDRKEETSFRSDWFTSIELDREEKLNKLGI
jgi:hypothetical protein